MWLMVYLGTLSLKKGWENMLTNNVIVLLVVASILSISTKLASSFLGKFILGLLSFASGAAALGLIYLAFNNSMSLLF